MNNEPLVPWLTATAFFGLAVMLIFFWVEAEDNHNKAEAALTSTQDDLRNVAHELDTTKKELQRCQSAPKPTEYVHTSGDKCGEFLAQCMELIENHTERVEEILR